MNLISQHLPHFLKNEMTRLDMTRHGPTDVLRDNNGRVEGLRVPFSLNQTVTNLVFKILQKIGGPGMSYPGHGEILKTWTE